MLLCLLLLLIYVAAVTLRALYFTMRSAAQCYALMLPCYALSRAALFSLQRYCYARQKMSPMRFPSARHDTPRRLKTLSVPIFAAEARCCHEPPCRCALREPDARRRFLRQRR